MVAVLYVTIVIYVLFVVLQIDIIANLGVALISEIIGFFVLAWLIYGNILFGFVKTGYFIPLILAAVVYTIILSVLNFWAVLTMPTIVFTLVHLLLLFVYCIVSIPMYIMGRK